MPFREINLVHRSLKVFVMTYATFVTQQVFAVAQKEFVESFFSQVWSVTSLIFPFC